METRVDGSIERCRRPFLNAQLGLVNGDCFVSKRLIKTTMGMGSTMSMGSTMRMGYQEDEEDDDNEK